jgi:hypothetical protein
MDQTSYVHDCTSNLIFIDQDVLTYKNDVIKLTQQQLIQTAKTVSDAALLFELNNSLMRYYYRPFDAHNGLLIGVVFSNGIWKVNEYFEDPSTLFLLTLFKKYLQHNNITLYRQIEIGDDFFRCKEVVQLGNCL